MPSVRSAKKGPRPRMRRALTIILACLLMFAAFLFLNNGPLFVAAHAGKLLLFSNGGLAQPYSTQGLTNQTCTAARSLPASHSYLENTIASMRATFALGTDIVEFDVQPTKDGRFAVFHDATLDCRTNGKGRTTDYTLAQLQRLDIGYGYTSDGGKSFPFRGKGVGLMPSLEEVLRAFPDKALYVDIKSNSAVQGTQLAQALATLPQRQQDLLTVGGGDRPVEALRQRLPHMRVVSKSIIQNCVLRYAAVGWTGYVPVACRHIELLLPDQIAPWLWGWPHRFLDRMAANDTRVILEKGNGTEEFSSGFDAPDDLKRLPPGYTGGIWTNRIDQIAPVYHHR